ncbi:Cof subfamily protein (haloacid dehalogenase superfamily)/HAD superfamily hydrolase (TIGR01484 family) [Entomoplasma freundtii]|uniref:Haloacid dehalogenase n=1 Tax=Entomoplasma freundtii TaxID=74700 RepID=A0A2K8NQU3_9MOLU|nr:HAD-IIB family hydrolase [Entomoplasma freundtii]ATZ16189.1 haloacid dehalogenase [Entomoplasma freundtii]TDY56910.1 Cof subfamily protein (haloacid dehalogenase superfamily)/HAD superfamily hydrolase (TIGR01484 family) [Entomoplasma freundtii]
MTIYKDEQTAASIKLLALDMDGTTYYKMGTMIPQNVKPLQAAMAEGVEIVFITGRPVLARANGLEGHGLVNSETIIAGYNGACIYALADHKPLKISPLKSTDAQAVFEYANQPENAGTVIFGYVDDFQTVITNASNPTSPNDKSIPYRAEMEFFDGQYLEYKNVEKNFNYNFFKLIAFGSPHHFCQSVVQKFGLTVSTSNNQDGEITAPGIDKAFALEWIAKTKKIHRDEIMAIGDGANDLPMIEYAGYGVSLSNSIPIVKEKAQIQVPLSNVEGGVAYAIDKYVLKDKPSSSSTWLREENK